MAEVFDCSDNANLLNAARAARQAVGSGRLVVMPTDTVYGIAADAFNPEAVQRLLDAKGRGRQSPPPVLIPNADTLAALATEVTEPVRTLAERFWPGPLTIVLTANPSLSWDLGDTGGTVALRIPDHPLALDLLRETGPLAVSSANTTGDPAARSIDQARDMLGESVAVYLDAGPVGSQEEGAPALPSTIVDATRLTNEGGVLRVLREGALSRGSIVDALPQVTLEV
jgi:tRNA threonylcarbamoyl adenosine modification protein (Sua5/YciO/YrdC/YwlC family)